MVDGVPVYPANFAGYVFAQPGVCWAPGVKVRTEAGEAGERS